MAKKERKKKVSSSSSNLLNTIIFGIQEKKGENIMCLDLTGIGSRVCDYFIVCDANSNTQVSALADSVKHEVKKKSGELPYYAEGYQNAEWILIDYVNVVVHIFQKQVREFYNIEGLWADAEIKTY